MGTKKAVVGGVAFCGMLFCGAMIGKFAQALRSWFRCKGRERFRLTATNIAAAAAAEAAALTDRADAAGGFVCGLLWDAHAAVV